MPAVHQSSTPISGPAPNVFQAALGVVQHTKSMQILAVHNEGRRLVALGKSMMTNARIYVIGVDAQDTGSALNVAVFADPRMRAAALDGTFNKKAAGKYVVAVESAFNGDAPAPPSPVPDHYVQKKSQIPWDDPSTEPDIQLGFSWLGLASHTN